MSFEIKAATRIGVRPLIGFYSESGRGKTYSSLLLARGLAGPTGKVVMVDTESGRGSLYADVIPGGYSVIELTEPFSPRRYIEAIEAAESSGAACVVVDSMSHEWEGPGGVCDMAGENEQKSGKAGLHNWKNPKIEHAKLVQKLLRSKCALVCCIRAKHKSRQTRENGKTVIVKDEFTSPIQSEDFIFEMTCHGEIMEDHSFRVTKCSHPELRKCFPDSGPITVKHGELLAKWCAAGTTSKPKAQPATDAKRKVWELTTGIHNKDAKKLQQWMVDEMILGPDEVLADLKPDRWTCVLADVEQRLAQTHNA